VQRTDANVDRVQTFVRWDQRFSVRLIAEGHGNLFRRKYPNSGQTSVFPTMTMPLHMMRSWLRNPLQNGPSTLFTWLSLLLFWLSKIKKRPEGTKIKGTAAATAQVNKFCFHRVIPGIKLAHLMYLIIKYRVRQASLLFSYCNNTVIRKLASRTLYMHHLVTVGGGGGEGGTKQIIKKKNFVWCGFVWKLC
jgi:hypothetical protein